MATMVDQNDRTKTVGEMHNIEGWTKSATIPLFGGREALELPADGRFNFPGRGDKYSSMKWVGGPLYLSRREANSANL